MADSDKRINEDFSVLPTRRIIGDRLLARLGKRAWERPNVAVSTRLYRYYDIQDPWDPMPHRGKWEAKLGPVSLRLGENKRQPARHLKPKETQTAKKKSVSPAKQFNPKGIPKAAKTKTPTPPPPVKPKPQTQLRQEFGGQSNAHKLFKMPMRPELEAQMALNKSDSGKTMTSSKPIPTVSKTKRNRPRIVSGDEAAERSILRPKSNDQHQGQQRILMKRTPTKSVAQIKENHIKKEQTMAEIDRSTPLTPKRPGQKTAMKPQEDNQKRFTMTRGKTSQRPSIKAIEEPKLTPSEPPPQSISPQPPPKPVDSFSLDDLFGAGGAENGPIRMKRRQTPSKSDPK